MFEVLNEDDGCIKICCKGLEFAGRFWEMGEGEVDKLGVMLVGTHNASVPTSRV